MAETFMEILPIDLDGNRYISLDFYSPDFSSDIIESIQEYFTDSDKTITETGSEILQSFTEQSKKFKEILKSDSNRDATTPEIEKNSKTYKGSLYMPLPNELATTQNHSWQSQEGVVANILDSIGGVKSTANNALGQAAKLTGTRQTLINPDYVQQYSGSELRGLSLNWTILPRSAEEAKTTMNVVRLLQQMSSPEKQVSGTLLTAPPFCVIEFVNDKLQDSTRLFGMVITTVNISYKGANMEMFSDGMPKQIDISLSLSERKMKTFHDWDETTKEGSK